MTAGKSQIPTAPRMEFQATPLAGLFTDGMNDDQIWAQLDLRSSHICKTLEDALEGGGAPEEGTAEDGGPLAVRLSGEAEEVEDAAIDIDMDEEDWSDEDDSMIDDEYSETEEDGSDEDEEGGQSHLGEETAALRDPSDEEEGDSDEFAGPSTSKQGRISKFNSRKKQKTGHPQLDDGFFELSSFNREVELAEAKGSSRGRLGQDEEDSEGDEDIDLFAPVGDDPEQDMEDGTSEGNLFSFATACYSYMMLSVQQSRITKISLYRPLKLLEYLGKPRYRAVKVHLKKVPQSGSMMKSVSATSSREARTYQLHRCCPSWTRTKKRTRIWMILSVTARMIAYSLV